MATTCKNYERTFDAGTLLSGPGAHYKNGVPNTCMYSHCDKHAAFFGRVVVRNMGQAKKKAGWRRLKLRSDVNADHVDESEKYYRTKFDAQEDVTRDFIPLSIDQDGSGCQCGCVGSQNA